MNDTSWQSYVQRLCTDAWALDDPLTAQLVTDLEAVVASGDFTDHDIVRVLCGAGVTQSAADMIAPSIRVAITA
jgi:hypothetical protein